MNNNIYSFSDSIMHIMHINFQVEFLCRLICHAHIDGEGGPGYFTRYTIGIATDLHQVTSDKSQVTSDEWYTIDGRKLNGKPAAKGVYIQNGKKTVVK